MPPETQFLLGEINAKLDQLIQRTNEDRTATRAEIVELRSRISTLEGFRWKLLGAATAVGGLPVLLSKLLGS